MPARKLGDVMEKQWWCVSCLAESELDTHGRCSACGSDAVDRIVGGAFLTAVRPTSGTSILTCPAGSHASAYLAKALLTLGLA
jgi:hypothetical protein